MGKNFSSKNSNQRAVSIGSPIDFSFLPETLRQAAMVPVNRASISTNSDDARAIKLAVELKFERESQQALLKEKEVHASLLLKKQKLLQELHEIRVPLEEPRNEHSVVEAPTAQCNSGAPYVEDVEISDGSSEGCYCGSLECCSYCGDFDKDLERDAGFDASLESLPLEPPCSSATSDFQELHGASMEVPSILVTTRGADTHGVASGEGVSVSPSTLPAVSDLLLCAPGSSSTLVGADLPGESPVSGYADHVLPIAPAGLVLGEQTTVGSPCLVCPPSESALGLLPNSIDLSTPLGVVNPESTIEHQIPPNASVLGNVASAPSQLKGNWAGLFNHANIPYSPGIVGETNTHIKLEYTEPCKDNGILSVEIPEDIKEEGASLWDGWLVGYFIDEKLPYMLIKNWAFNLWGKFGMNDVLTMENGFFLFKFQDARGREHVLGNAPWHIAGKLIVLRPWEPNLKLVKDSLSSIPIWIKLFNVPLDCWTPKGLGRIASAIGRPIRLDDHTANRSRIAFARVCVDVSIDDPLPDSFIVKLKDGEEVVEVNIRVEYPWKPQKCDNYEVFGHSTKACKKVPKKVWQAVNVAKDNNVGAKEVQRGAPTGEWEEVHRSKEFKKASQVNISDKRDGFS